MSPPFAEDPSTAECGVDRYTGSYDGYDGELLAHDVGGGYDGQEVRSCPTASGLILTTSRVRAWRWRPSLLGVLAVHCLPGIAAGSPPTALMPTAT
jgi:hypothetical protein